MNLRRAPAARAGFRGSSLLELPSRSIGFSIRCIPHGCYIAPPGSGSASRVLSAGRNVLPMLHCTGSGNWPGPTIVCCRRSWSGAHSFGARNITPPRVVGTSGSLLCSPESSMPFCCSCGLLCAIFSVVDARPDEARNIIFLTPPTAHRCYSGRGNCYALSRRVRRRDRHVRNARIALHSHAPLRPARADGR